VDLLAKVFATHLATMEAYPVSTLMGAEPQNIELLTPLANSRPPANTRRRRQGVGKGGGLVLVVAQSRRT